MKKRMSLTGLNPTVRYHFLFLFLVLNTLKCYPLPDCHYTHYSVNDGLPQFTIMDMVQDKAGFLWLGTWDGLSRFDGYEFKNVKVKKTDNYTINSNRIEKLFPDTYGRIWFKTYDKDIHCYNPSTGRFWGIQLVDGLKNCVVRNIQIQPSGKVWLLLNDGCLLVRDSLFATMRFRSAVFRGQTVNSIFEDSKQRTWFLTSKGLFLTGANGVMHMNFSDAKGRIKPLSAYYSATETNKAIYVGSDGKLIRYEKNTGIVTTIKLRPGLKIEKIVRSGDNRLILVTAENGFLIYNTDNAVMKEYSTRSCPELKSNHINDVYLPENNDLWFDTDELGIYHLNLNTMNLTFHPSMADDPFTSAYILNSIVFRDIKGRLWVQPRGGGFALYNAKKEKLESFLDDKNLSARKFSNVVFSAMSDFQGNLWLCSRSHGLEKFVFDRTNFRLWKIDPHSPIVLANEVRMTFEDSQQRKWISTKDFKLYVYDRDNRLLGNFSTKGCFENGAVLPAAVYCMMEDKDKNLWLGTRGDGVYRLTKTTRPGCFHVEHFVYNASDVFSISQNSIYSILQDSNGRIWIGTYGGGLNLVQFGRDEKVRFVNYRNNLTGFPQKYAYRIRCISENRHGTIFLGTTGGLVVFSSHFDKPQTIRFQTYKHVGHDANSLSCNDIHQICQTRKGEMYIATFGGGLNTIVRKDSRGFPLSFRSYTKDDGLPSDIVLSVAEDDSEKLWITSENNLIRFDPKSGLFQVFPEISRLMQSDYFSEASIVRLKSGTFCLNYSNGLILFEPSRIYTSRFTPSIAFTDLQIFNKTVGINDEQSPLQVDINATRRLVLSHNQSFVNIEFAALDLSEPNNIQYAYKLEGYDNEWNYVYNQRTAYYTNLPKGHYIFRVKSTDSEGVWKQNERILPIDVLPSFWNSVWAYLLYVVLSVLLFYVILYILMLFLRLRTNVMIEKNMSDLKLKFFTDVSHELRTPLSLVVGPIEHIINNAQTPAFVRDELVSVYRNTNRILNLINRILDVRKLQQSRLQVKEQMLIRIVRKVCKSFESFAREHAIRLELQNHLGNMKLWFDRQGIEDALVNLLSNAFKYSGTGKQIRVVLREDERSVYIDVVDFGEGIPQALQSKIFDRFTSFNDDTKVASSGIGLSVVKEIMKKHHGDVTVDSNPETGTVFTLRLPKGVTHFAADVDIVADDFSDYEEVEISSADEEGTMEVIAPESDYPSLLIVEDDGELRQFIRRILQQSYRLYEATDGQEGYEKAKRLLPDFIISDVMMPRLNGIDMLKSLREDFSTSHIPVIMLTAKTNIEDKLEGLAFGADDYITKPFSVTYLKARIANLLDRQRHLQSKVLAGELITQNGEQNQDVLEITSADQLFLEKINTYIEDNLENEDMVVEDICGHVNVSRSVLYKKIKSLTGLSPLDFIKAYKMQKAAWILIHQDVKVKELAYMVGMNDVRYFSKCFKEHFGVVPQYYKSSYLEGRGWESNAVSRTLDD